MKPRKNATAILCRVKVGDVRCRYNQLDLPTGGKSPMCYWHRIMRTSMDAQIREAERRLRTAETDGKEHVLRVPPAQWPDGERWCSGCQSFVPLFYCTGSRCKACAARSARDTRRMSVYGLTPAGFRELAELQGDRCAICRKHQTAKSIAIDHNHKTGAVRGLLCQQCNHKVLGGAYDSFRIILAAAVYLATPPADGDWLDPEEHGNAIGRAFLAMLDDMSRAQAAERRAAEVGRTASGTAKD